MHPSTILTVSVPPISNPAAFNWSRQLKRVNGKVNFTDADGVIYDFSTPKNQVLARNQHILHYVLTGELNGELQLT
ncbi:hypothetical protein, partial [Xenorhabdus bovienii]|uniref:hypothetical protein n=1 Tax=Xenorhabdus bovienii TaxID=40576 RepID=UPI003DA20CD8